MTIEEFERIVDEKSKDKDYGICPPPISDRETIHILTEHLLGKGYYIAFPLGVEQCNTVIIEDIITKYPEKGAKVKCFLTSIKNMFMNFLSMVKK